MPKEINEVQRRVVDTDAAETHDWIDALKAMLKNEGPQRVQYLLNKLVNTVREAGITVPGDLNTPYINTIPADRQPPYPGDRELERRIKSLIRWNAMAMVVRANRQTDGVGGHISTYASAATLVEVGFNHFFRGKGDDHSGDQVYYQGHASPGIYARAFLEGRLMPEQILNFRRELQPGGGLSSYPHPWLMPDFWEFPTVSMGLGPIMSIYQARFNRYLHHRGIKNTESQRVWCFLGDGECDEPESLGAISLAAREQLDNLTFIINCNLQRLDGPVRGNGKIIQDLEAVFRGAGWNVIKVIWGDDWDELLARDTKGLLVKRMTECVDGQYQKYVVESGDYIRREFFGAHPELLKMVEHLSDQQLRKLRRGGHDPEKVYAAFKAAVEHKGQPTVILAKTIKGYGLGEAGEGRNITHQQKKLNEEELRNFRARFGIPISDEDVSHAPLYRPPDDSPEIQYLLAARKALGGFSPSRVVNDEPLPMPPASLFDEFFEGTKDHPVSTTMAYVRMLSKLLRDSAIGKYIVPIIPDEARTFGMEALFRQCGIYSSRGQVYEPVDSETLMYYKEAVDGQILEEGINEAGGISSFIAAGTAYATHGIPMVPFYTYYSMFGFQRVGDLIWAAGDMQAKGFLVGATAGRTTLNGEGLQHQDGHSHLLATTVPNIMAYEPAFAYDIAVILREGLRRMYQEGEPIFYYLSVQNENYAHPPIPADVEDGILKGIYPLRKTPPRKGKPVVQLFGSGSILLQALQAQDLLQDRYGIGSQVWNVTSYKQLRMDGMACDRWNRLHPENPRKIPYLTQVLQDNPGAVIAVSDNVRLVCEQVAAWIPGGMMALGTDGFGRSESREALRRFFEIDAGSVVAAALYRLHQDGLVTGKDVREAIARFDIDPELAPPWTR